MDRTKKTLLLVDGSSYIYRAFHAVTDYDPAKPNGAIRGIVNMLKSARRKYPTDYAACVFDAKGKNFREDIYPGYKAQRPPMPEALRPQIEPIHEIVGLLGWNILDIPGVEADDVIGTLARVASNQGIKVTISSGDKDFAQLVTDNVTVIDTMNGRVRDQVGVLNEFGIPPSLMIDYQSLIGDKVDNIPGVPLVGEKTAVKWLREYGSLDAILQHANTIKGVVGTNLRKSLEWIPVCKRLVTIKTDVEGLPAVESFKMKVVSNYQLSEFYKKHDFKYTPNWYFD